MSLPHRCEDGRLAGDLLRTARLLVGLSCQEVANALGVDISLLSRIECGHLSITPERAARVRLAIADALLDRGGIGAPPRKRQAARVAAEVGR